MTQTLRDYQLNACSALETSEKRRSLLVSPVGSGKTTIIAETVRRARERGRRVLLLAHREELCEQARERLRLFGLSSATIYSGRRGENSLHPIQVAMIQTLARRPEFPPADVVILDEAHHALADQTSELLRAYAGARILGFTATPWRLDGRGLGEHFEELIVATTPSDLVKQGHLVPLRGFFYSKPDMTGVKINAGDYSMHDAEERMNVLRGDIVRRWLETASDRTTVVFATTVAHSLSLRQAFADAGVTTAHVDGGTARGERARIFSELQSGEVRVLVNVGVATEGIDVPRIKCVVLARPTKSWSLFIQQIGRGRRPWGDLDCRVHDHAGCIESFGHPDLPMEFTLLDRDRREKPAGNSLCPWCKITVVMPGETCFNPVCPGPSETTPEKRDGVPEVEEGDEQEIVAGKAVRLKTPKRLKTVGESVEGVLVELGTVNVGYGPEKTAVLSDGYTERVVILNRQAADALHSGLIGRYVRIRYDGDVPLANGNTMKKMVVQIRKETR